ncbi:ribosomal protein L17 [Melampsora americana]|nr:ribosomal protein L17 [Melampsora americana]
MKLAKLNRSISHRNSMFRNMVSSLIEHEQIKTTLPKAKAISRLTERLITWTKAGTENIFYQRKTEAYLMNWTRLRSHLFQTLAKRYEHRIGGYTRIHRLGHRTDDHAPLAIIEMVDNFRDLKRDQVIRTAARELASLELSSRSSNLPRQIWRNVRCESEEEAKGVIEGVKRWIAPLTKKNLEKVLSEGYVKAYEYCQPIRIPTKEEAQAEILRIKAIKREAFLTQSITPTLSSDSSRLLPSIRSTSSDSSSPNQILHSRPSLTHSLGLPKPIGAYTDFLYQLRVHFHRNLISLDPSKLDRRSSNQALKPNGSQKGGVIHPLDSKPLEVSSIRSLE